MFHHGSLRFVGLALALGASACTQSAAYYDGSRLTGLKLKLSDPDEGIYPSLAALQDPNNPFAQSSMGDQTKWNATLVSPVAGFYAWATVNARQPYGESQFYVGVNLQTTYHVGGKYHACVADGGTADGGVADGGCANGGIDVADYDDLPSIKNQGIRAFQMVLDDWPTDVSYLASGAAYPLATPAYQAIQDLGGTVTGGWVLVTDTLGNPLAVKP